MSRTGARRSSSRRVRAVESVGCWVVESRSASTSCKYILLYVLLSPDLYHLGSLARSPKRLVQSCIIETSMLRVQFKQLTHPLRTACDPLVSKLKSSSHTLSASVALVPSSSASFKSHLQRRYLATFRTMAPQLDGYFKQ